MRSAVILAALYYAAGTGTVAQAAMLRPFSQIDGGIVHLADLFDALGATPDRALGAAPAPGTRIVVNAPQLAAIARDFGVDWRPGSGGESAVVERRCDLLAADAVASALRASLEAQGAPPRSEIAMPSFEPVPLPVGANAEPQITQLAYDPSNGRFTALLTVDVPGLQAAQRRLSGQAIATADAAVPTHDLAAGGIVEAGDVRTIRVHASLLHGRAPILAADAIGMEIRHAVASGQPLTPAELGRQVLVPRGAAVRMVLESAGIALAAQGIALDPGALGERIRVQNPGSHAIVEGDVTGAGEIRIRPRGAPVSLAAAQ